ncbi:SIMPL domain-containing protein [Methylobacterium haplocladii]|uniref:Outer membrane protein n=1 Tax=Methylobacterium haplocladii TaxID=1176176 RepID=A0A512IS06_9HYPH|nr:SIMPL domain-containing protein [Methylobacterium haplocladii]GEP00488.1 outer membrane protein [Methylobacterium haplocladii]GJD82490.1 26 kDa periplasmic immunogenic protein [Methylobacterium haplocladii]GLS59575.1 outer membrane protein [Methylobacterium haplocladii]
MRAATAALAALLALALCVPALADDDDKGGRISVIGRAQVETPPDFAAVEIGVQSKGATPAAALDAASNAARGIIATAKEIGVPEADIGTSSITLQPVTRQIRQPDGSVREQADGYAAANRVVVRLGDMPKLGELMRRALDAGSNRIDGVSFGLRDPAAVQSSVQVAAMRDARAQAERLAEAAGVKLGSAISITSPPRAEGARPMPYAAMAKSAAPRGRAAVPVEAGSIESSAEVEAVFAILP